MSKERKWDFVHWFDQQRKQQLLSNIQLALCSTSNISTKIWNLYNLHLSTMEIFGASARKFALKYYEILGLGNFFKSLTLLISIALGDRQTITKLVKPFPPAVRQWNVEFLGVFQVSLTKLLLPEKQLTSSCEIQDESSIFYTDIANHLT